MHGYYSPFLAFEMGQSHFYTMTTIIGIVSRIFRQQSLPLKGSHFIGSGLLTGSLPSGKCVLCTVLFCDALAKSYQASEIDLININQKLTIGIRGVDEGPFKYGPELCVLAQTKPCMSE